MAAEQRLIDWYERGANGIQLAGEGKYYMSYHYGNQDSEDYWWENGILTDKPEGPALEGLEDKRIGFGTYACCVSKTYGLLTGVLDNMHRWIATSGNCRLDEERQWFAEYHTFEGMNIERDSIVKVYIPILSGEGAWNETFRKEG
jgi:hypothetical protein